MRLLKRKPDINQKMPFANRFGILVPVQPLVAIPNLITYFSDQNHLLLCMINIDRQLLFIDNLYNYKHQKAIAIVYLLQTIFARRMGLPLAMAMGFGSFVDHVH